MVCVCNRRNNKIRQAKQLIVKQKLQHYIIYTPTNQNPNKSQPASTPRFRNCINSRTLNLYLCI